MTNPFAGLLPNFVTLNGRRSPASISCSPIPQFGSRCSPRNRWDALVRLPAAECEQAVQQEPRRFVAYTFSKQIDAISSLNSQDPVPTKTLASADRTLGLW